MSHVTFVLGSQICCCGPVFCKFNVSVVLWPFTRVVERAEGNAVIFELSGVGVGAAGGGEGGTGGGGGRAAGGEGGGTEGGGDAGGGLTVPS